MPMWMPGTETQLYRFFAKIAALLLGRMNPVVSVYVRRSVACGEVVLRKSDIDLHVLIKPFADVSTEAEFLRDFTRKFLTLKRRLPGMGHCEVSTFAELAHWYQIRAYSWYRDRGWLRLYGQECERPQVSLSDEECRDSLLWWFFQVWESLPAFYRTGDVRNCCNQLLDMVNAYGFYIGAFTTPQRRADLLQYWQKVSPPTCESSELRTAYRHGFRGDYRALKPWLYQETLRLSDTLYAHVVRKLEGEGCPSELHSHVPFAFSRRTYRLVDPLCPADVTRALTDMEKNPGVCVTTEKALKLYLYHRNPWEYYSLQAHNQPFPFSPPPPEALQRAVRFSLHREVPRRAGFAIGRKIDRNPTIGLQSAQCRLYLEQGKIAVSAADLLQQYKLACGTWPYREISSLDDYFLYTYPEVCRTIAEISQKVT
ncbi:MAG: hypothetical protein HY268_32120 [Deltaproteobacteria bacterium]|nr:hypothetical protein [Deltaproteobacteria bacterium]